MDGPAPSSRVNPRLLLALAGLGGLVLGLLVLGAMSGGAGDQSVRSPSRPAGNERPAPTGPDTSLPGVAPPSLLTGRDPFSQLVTESEAQPAQEAGRAESPASADASAPTGAASPPADPGGGEGASPGPAVEGADHATLELQAVSKDEAGVERATVTVDGQVFNPAAGEVFSYGFRLERIEGSCVEASSGAARATMCLPAAA
ncbi:MAG TPA: hypothetical protein VG455_16655 [Acidimicrobiales bacterium]|nr:hypothetical protein [Acidimicrobiales bacterium]